MLTVDILRNYINISLYCASTEAHIPEAAIGLHNSAHLQWRQALLRPHVSPSVWQGRCRRDLKNLSFATQWSMGRLSLNLEMIQWVARMSFKFLKRCHALGGSIGRSVNMRKRTKTSDQLERLTLEYATSLHKMWWFEFEFELIRSMHTKKQGICSITFKKALADQLLQAWRILRRASMDRVLLSSSQEFDGQSSFCYSCLSFRPCSSSFRCCLVRKANPKQYTHTHTTLYVAGSSPRDVM